MVPDSYRTFPAGDGSSILSQQELTAELVFDSGVRYTITLGQALITVESSDMSYGTAYALADASATLARLSQLLNQ